ncbi:hypothetical protein NECAME_09139 [Necator americanus]|uniref:Uncharacterized protein n=1 Tax=Necator americanus TaxID=51031 RepID=W2THH8_NECAM|nr:hypothetical protein NECAME_09139 [Necator americanus]ETN80467.1 hypothetical protein NECAME_09139 [Necator americanus]
MNIREIRICNVSKQFGETLMKEAYNQDTNRRDNISMIERKNCGQKIQRTTHRDRSNAEIKKPESYDVADDDDEEM